MSDYRTKIGRVRRLKEFSSKEDFDKNFENWCEKYLRYIFLGVNRNENINASYQLSDYFESTDREMIIANNSIWLIENCEDLDDEDSYCHLKKTDDDDVFEFHTRFYDGGTWEGEMIRDEIERLKL